MVLPARNRIDDSRRRHSAYPVVHAVGNVEVSKTVQRERLDVKTRLRAFHLCTTGAIS